MLPAAAGGADGLRMKKAGLLFAMPQYDRCRTLRVGSGALLPSGKREPLLRLPTGMHGRIGTGRKRKSEKSRVRSEKSMVWKWHGVRALL